AASNNVGKMIQTSHHYCLYTVFQRELDSSATLLASRQDDSEQSRKKLIDQSRNFKKNTPEVSYMFLSSLSCRCLAPGYAPPSQTLVRFASPCLAVDAEGCLLLIVCKYLDIGTGKSRSVCVCYGFTETCFVSVEVTIKTLKEKIRDYEQSMRSQAENLALEKHQQIHKDYAEKERSFQESHESLVGKLQEAELKAQTLQTALERTQTELFDLKTKYDEESTRAEAAEREVEALREQLTSANKSTQPPTRIDSTPYTDESGELVSRSSLESELSAKEREMLQLVEDVQRLQASLSTLRESSAAQISQLQQQLKSQTATLQVDNLTQTTVTLSMLKSMEFGPCDRSTAQDSCKPLEVLLLEKNRSLQSESASLRIANTELSSRCASLQLELSSAVKTSAEQKELILKLEQDLSTIQTMSRPDAEGADSSAVIVPEPIKEATALFTGVGGSPQTDLPQGQMDSMLSIISSQRERYRSRNQELEAANSSLQQTSQALQSQLDSLRADNIKLYEKIKFLQSYPNRAGDSDDTVMRYSSQYEERLDPFTSFSKRERHRRYQSLSPWDKATLSLGRVILSNKMARTVAFFYTLMLHCLVFLVLYKAAWSESIGRDCAAFCAKKYSDHLHRFHEDGDTWQ
uniref:Protein CASP n=1 Tax=Sinocyclocheilus rhinocerous TaxID=307959 RepID=A0A673H0A4_9TELE